MVEWGQDARGERWGTTALDQLDQGVQVDRTLTRQPLGQLAVEAGLAQAGAAPGDDLARSWARPPRVSGSKVHISLARTRGRFLPPDRDLRQRDAKRWPMRAWATVAKPPG
jgi:hypothetical protein